MWYWDNGDPAEQIKTKLFFRCDDFVQKSLLSEISADIIVGLHKVNIPWADRRQQENSEIRRSWQCHN